MTAPLRRQVSVDQDCRRCAIEKHEDALNRYGHGQHGRLQDIDSVNLSRIHFTHRPNTARAYLQIEHSPAFRGQFFGVRQAGGRIITQYRRPGDDRPRQWSSARLIHADDDFLGTKSVFGCCRGYDHRKYTFARARMCTVPIAVCACPRKLQCCRIRG